MTAMVLPAKPWTNGMLTADQRYYYDSTVGTEGAWRANPIPVGNVPAGTIVQWASNTIPANWLLCDGSAVSRSVYPSLFATIGTQYGVGDGSTTFNLPDIPNGDAAGIVSSVRINSQVTVTQTLTDLSGVTQTVNLKGGRTYRITFSSPNLNCSGTGRSRFDIIANGALVARDYVGVASGIGGVAFNVQALFTPSSDGAYTIKVAGMVDAGTATTMTVYADGNSTTLFNVEDMGEAGGSSLRQRNIIKATIGVTAGDSQLAVRTAVLETNPVISGNMSLAGNASIGGRVTAINQPAFLAQPTANNNASNAVGIFTSVTINTGNCYSTSTGRFTAPVAGSYMFTGSAMPQANTAVEFWRFRKNGVKIGPWTYAINGDQILTQTLVIPLAANDYVDLFFVSDGYEYLFTSFSGHLIG